MRPWTKSARGIGGAIVTVFSVTCGAALVKGPMLGRHGHPQVGYMSSEELSPRGSAHAAPEDVLSSVLGEREAPIPIHRDGELVSVITHDLRQPLSAAELNVAAALHYLRRQEPLAEEAVDALLDAQGQQRRLRDSIRALHALSERREAFFSGIDAVTVLWDVVRRVAAEAMHRVPIRVVVSPPVPSVAVDVVQMREVLRDIAHGAIDAVEKGTVAGASVTIEVRAIASAAEIVVAYPGSKPEAALLDRWTDAVAHAVDTKYSATLTVADDVTKDVRIVTRWPADVASDTRDAARGTSLPLSS
jgi:signal transduction histidine kinase